MVIACYAGVGKSTLADRYPEEAIDLCSMPFSWILSGRDSGGEHEGSKAAPWLLRSPAFPDNYMAAVLEESRRYRYVLIPPIPQILRELWEKYRCPYILCYPEISLKEEYRARYEARGNGEHFVEIFVDQWEERISSLMEDGGGRHVRLGAGMFLTDAKEELDAVIASAGAFSDSARDGEIGRLKEKADRSLGQGCLWFIRYEEAEPYCSYGLFPLDLRDPENREWAYELGRSLWEREDVRVEAVEAQRAEGLLGRMEAVRRLGSRQEAMAYLGLSC